MTNDENATARIRHARVLYHIKVEGLSRRFNLLLKIPALQEKHDAFLVEIGGSELEKLRQRRERPRRHDVGPAGHCLRMRLDPFSGDAGIRPRLADDGAEKRGLLGVRLQPA